MSNSFHPPQHFGVGATIAPTSWMLKPKDEALKNPGRVSHQEAAGPTSASRQSEPSRFANPHTARPPDQRHEPAAEELRGAMAWPWRDGRGSFSRSSLHPRLEWPQRMVRSVVVLPGTGCWDEMWPGAQEFAVTGQRRSHGTRKALSTGEATIWLNTPPFQFWKKNVMSVSLLGPWHCYRMERASWNPPLSSLSFSVSFWFCF